MSRPLFLHGLCFALLMTFGCGSSDQPLSGIDAEARWRTDALGEVGSLLTVFKGEHNKAPAKVQDLARYERGMPSGFERIKAGDIVVLWGAPIVEGEASKVIAYEKATPESGGYVLMQDGSTVKQMTAEEFKAAPKASKG